MPEKENEKGGIALKTEEKYATIIVVLAFLIFLAFLIGPELV